MNIEAMYRSALAEIAHKPDPRKGKTSREWAIDFGKWLQWAQMMKSRGSYPTNPYSDMYGARY